MDTGKIFLGIALIAFSVAMVINPAHAAGSDSSCLVGNGYLHTANCQETAGYLQESDSVSYSSLPAVIRNEPGNLP